MSQAGSHLSFSFACLGYDECRLIICTREGLFKQISSACLQRNFSTMMQRINRGVSIGDHCSCIDIVYFEATAELLFVIIGKLKCIPSISKAHTFAMAIWGKLKWLGLKSRLDVVETTNVRMAVWIKSM
jgi:hypothetical protein